jgi:hypothetical protein
LQNKTEGQSNRIEQTGDRLSEQKMCLGWVSEANTTFWWTPQLSEHFVQELSWKLS